MAPAVSDWLTAVVVVLTCSVKAPESAIWLGRARATLPLSVPAIPALEMISAPWPAVSEALAPAPEPAPPNVVVTLAATISVAVLPSARVARWKEKSPVSV